VRTTTTTSLTPQQIHELGLSEVKRIHEEMDKVIKETKFKGSFADFSKFLRTDAKFYYNDADSLLEGYRDIAKRIDPELARLFGKLPRLPYGVRPVPAYAEKSQTTAYYQPGAPEAGRPGWYYANTYALGTRPKWEMEALTLHEAVPGHHLQIALSQEMQDAPEFRKHGGVLFNRHVALGRQRVQRTERITDQFSRKLDQFEGARRRRIDEQLAAE